MVKREIYFVNHGQLFKKSVEVTWDNDSMILNREVASAEVFSNSPSWLQPCVDVSSGSISLFRTLSIYQVKDESNNSVSDLWKLLDGSKDVDMLPPGAYDLIYLSNLSERQVQVALSVRSFYDIYYNSSKKKTSPAKALCALQMLYYQNKLDYLADMNKFLYWYFINCQYPLEYCESREVIWEEDML